MSGQTKYPPWLYFGEETIEGRIGLHRRKLMVIQTRAAQPGIVQGKPQFLQIERVTDWIRTLLLAAVFITAAVCVRPVFERDLPASIAEDDFAPPRVQVPRARQPTIVESDENWLDRPAGDAARAAPAATSTVC